MQTQLTGPPPAASPSQLGNPDLDATTRARLRYNALKDLLGLLVDFQACFYILTTTRDGKQFCLEFLNRYIDYYFHLFDAQDHPISLPGHPAKNITTALGILDIFIKAIRAELELHSFEGTPSSPPDGMHDL